MIKILNKIGSNELHNELEKIITHHQFPWYWRPSTKYGIDEGNLNSEDFQFVHIICSENKQESDIFPLVCNLLYEFEKETNIKIKNIHKIKANLLPKQSLTNQGLEESIHIDKKESNYISLVYYVSDSDGDTVVYKDNNVFNYAPKKGSAIYFSSNLKHRATPPSIHKRRIVLNIVLEI